MSTESQNAGAVKDEIEHESQKGQSGEGARRATGISFQVIEINAFPQNQVWRSKSFSLGRPGRDPDPISL